MTRNLVELDKQIGIIKQRGASKLELPDEKWILQSGPFNSVQHFFDSSFQSFRELLYFTNITPSKKILDYGCGLARLAIPLSDYLDNMKGSYCGVDTDNKCIKRNKRVFKHLPNFKFHHVDIYSKMYNRWGRDYQVLLKKDFGGPFDLAFLFSVFTHVLPEDCDFLLKFLHSQLSPSAEIFASFFLLNDVTQQAIDDGKAHRRFTTSYGNARIDNPKTPEGAVAYYETDILERFARAGFADAEVHYGKWRGNNDGWIWQDIIVANRPDEKALLDRSMESGAPRSVAKLSPRNRAQRKLLFMHIAKAAGSTVNAFFAEHYSTNQYAVHIESNLKWKSNPDDLKGLDFLSGHISLHMLKKKLKLEDYYKVTVIREPYAQLCSHLAWIKRLSMPGEEQRFYAHPAYIQTFAKKLAAIDFSEPRDLRDLLGSLAEPETRLIDNCQVRYFTFIPPGQAAEEVDANKAVKAAKDFDRIGLTDSINDFMKDVASDMSWPEPDEFVRENITQDFYGLDLSDRETRAVLWPLVQHDMTLYEHVANLQNHF